MIIWGYDPGGGGASGKRKSGVAILDTDYSKIRTGQCESVSEALSWFSCQEKGPPTALGIDTFLHWSTGRKGWRPVDEMLRKNYTRARNSIQPSNSTAGSMVVQGMALAITAKKRWNGLRLNEVHPKIIFAEFNDVPYPRDNDIGAVEVRSAFISSRGYSCSGNLTSEDEFDAAICCIATAEGIKGLWPNLICDAGTVYLDAQLLFPAGNVEYFWPRKLT